eukprot:GHUV01042922.1.p1 GENE.GHUV01042922.1~~GHUV01042922.1.p1  ORF type:complete len:101 (+),score=16.74 GHUV01042922.1:430-732(+)
MLPAVAVNHFDHKVTAAVNNWLNSLRTNQNSVYHTHAGTVIVNLRCAGNSLLGVQCSRCMMPDKWRSLAAAAGILNRYEVLLLFLGTANPLTVYASCCML